MISAAAGYVLCIEMDGSAGVAGGGIKSKLSIDVDDGRECERGERREAKAAVFLLRPIIPDEALRALPKRVSVSFLHARAERSADIGDLSLSLFFSSVVLLLDRGRLRAKRSPMRITNVNPNDIRVSFIAANYRDELSRAYFVKSYSLSYQIFCRVKNLQEDMTITREDYRTIHATHCVFGFSHETKF